MLISMKSFLEKIKIVDVNQITTFILSFIFLNIALTSVLFLIGVGISNLHFLTSIIISAIVTYVINKKNTEEYSIKKVIVNWLISILIIFLSIMIANIFYDNTWDGNTYHKEMIGLMKNGMNPVYNENSGDVWVQHYARAVETYAAVVYAFTGNIESGKSINILLMLMLGVQVFKFLKKKNVNNIISTLIGLAVAVNPISLIQSTSYYVDGVFTNVLFFLMLELLKITDSKEIKLKSLSFFWVSMLTVICINIKFTSLLICTMFIGVFCIYWLYISIAQKKLGATFKKLFFFFVAVYIFAVVIVGESVYVKNFVKYGHPFYPLKGENTGVDIVSGNEPEGLAEKSHVEKFIYTLFSKTYTWYDKKPELKIPFTVYKDELYSMQFADTRIGAFGPWYSGMLLLSLPIVLFYLIKKFIKKDKNAILLLLILMAIVLPIPILPVVWQLRYYPQLYLLPIIAILLIVLDSDKMFKKIYSYLLITATLVNTLLFVPAVFDNFKSSIRINKQLIYIYEQSLTKKVTISIEDCPNAGARYNLVDKHITNYTFLMEKMEDGEPMYFRFFYKIEEGE